MNACKNVDILDMIQSLQHETLQKFYLNSIAKIEFQYSDWKNLFFYLNEKQLLYLDFAVTISLKKSEYYVLKEYLKKEICIDTITGISIIGEYNELYSRLLSSWKNAKKIRNYLEFADQGRTSHAQFKLGHMYAYGNGTVDKDIDKAFEWYVKAAKQKHPSALYELALLYQKKNDNQRFYGLLAKAAHCGHIIARTILDERLEALFLEQREFRSRCPTPESPKTVITERETLNLLRNDFSSKL